MPKETIRVTVGGRTLTEVVQVPATLASWRRRFSPAWIQRALVARLRQNVKCRLRAAGRRS